MILDPFIVVLISTFFVLSVIFWFTRFGQSNKWLQYIGMISGLGVSVFVLQFIVENQRQYELRKKDYTLNFTAMAERYVIDLEKWFAAEYPYSTRIYKELYPNHPGLKSILLPALIDKSKQAAMEAHICGILIQIVRNVCIAEELEKSYQDPSLSGWMITFRRWFSSPILQNQWTYLKTNYGSKTFREFVEKHLINQTIPLE